MFTLRKRYAQPATASRTVIKRGYWVLRTLDPRNPDGPAMDPETGSHFSSIQDVIPAGWEEAVRDEYIPGAERARGYKSHVSIFPHEVVIVDPRRFGVALAERVNAGPTYVSAKTCVPTWIFPLER